MTKTLSLRVHRRNPFAIESLPFMARLLRAAYSKRRRFSKRFVGKPAKKLFRLLYHGFGLGGRGRLSLDLGGTAKSLSFDVRNTQFGALYLPQNRRGYEPDTSALLDVLVADDAVFYDIGANWGYYALLIASRPGFCGTVHAFEPMPATFADLASLVDQAGLAATVHCHRVALSDAAGEGTMALPDGTQSGLARLGDGGDGGDGGVQVPLRTLDAIIAEDRLAPPAVIKIDVEGHESAAFAGARLTLEREAPMVVFESWLEAASPDTTLGPFRLLEAIGYRFFVPCWRHGRCDAAYADAALPEGDDAVLQLVEMAAGQRFLMADQINVLACPAARLGELAAVFKD